MKFVVKIQHLEPASALFDQPPDHVHNTKYNKAICQHFRIVLSFEKHVHGRTILKLLGYRSVLGLPGEEI
jgi:hypothetical protein